MGSLSGLPLAPAAVVYQDEDILVVDKPHGVSVDAPERAHDNLLARVRAVGAALHPHATTPYVRALQPLERDVSGLVVLSRSPEANRVLGEFVRDRRIESCYVVALSATASFLRSQRIPVRATAGPGADSSLVPFECLHRRDKRAMIETAFRNVSARQLRAAIGAHAGCRLAGDSGDSTLAAPRLLLHRSQLRFEHPVTRVPLTLRAPPPRVFRRWIEQRLDVDSVTEAEFSEALTHAIVRRFSWQAGAGGAEAVRLLHGEGEGVGGVDVERYCEYLVVWVAERASEPVRQYVLDAAAATGALGVYGKVRPKCAHRVGPEQSAAFAPCHAARGADAPSELVVSERGMRFGVRLGDGQTTGLFLDQRDNREWVRQHAAGRSVLNLFAHTCAFTVAAAAGGARASVSVDSSRRVLDLGFRNLELNAISSDLHELVQADAIEWLDAACRGTKRFDIIILDPPTFSTTRRSRFVLERDYELLSQRCIQLLPDAGGTLLACLNRRTVHSATLLRWLDRATHRAGRALASAVPVVPPDDFPVAPGGEPHVKAFLLHLAPR